MMSESPPKRPKQVTSLAVAWTLFGLWNLWNVFQGIRAYLEVANIISSPLLPAWFKMAIPVELALLVALLIAALVQLLTVPLLLIRKPYSIKLALGVFVTIAIFNLISGALYASAPLEFRSDFTTDMVMAFGLGIFQMIVVAYFWRDLNKPEVKNYFKPTTSQQKVFQEEIVAKKEDKKVDTEPKFYCRYCGVENKKDAVYCESCGRKLKEP